MNVLLFIRVTAIKNSTPYLYVFIMLNSTSNLVAHLNTGTFWINRILPPLQIIFGTFGNLFNMIIFTRRSLRINPCSIYFLVGSVNNFFVIYVDLLTRYLATSWNLDPTTTNTALCKLRNIFVYASVCLVLWLVVLAGIDRFLSTSHDAGLRRLSSLPIARKIIISTTIFIFLIHVHMLIFYRSDVSDDVSICSIFSSEYNIFFNFFFLIVSCILPIILMIIFGILVILNVRNTRNRVARQANDAQNDRLRSNDRQLVIMLLFQVMITTLFSAPFSVINIYNTIAITMLKHTLSTYNHAIYNFASNLFRLLYYTNPVVGFYIYTLTSTRFRTEMKRCIRYGLKSALTATGLLRYLPLRAQQALLDQNRMGVDSASLTLARRQNIVHPIQHQKPTNMTSAL